MACIGASSVKRVKPTVEGSRDEITRLHGKLHQVESELAFLRKMTGCPLQVDFEGDVEFILDKFGSERVQAHQFVLVNKSTVFQKMFQHGMEANRTGKIKISNTSAPVLRAFLNYLYKAQIQFGPNVGAADVYHLANKYDIPDLVQACECKIIESLSDSNLPKVFKLAQRYNSRSLLNAVHRHSSESLRNAAFKYAAAFDLHTFLYPRCAFPLPRPPPDS